MKMIEKYILILTHKYGDTAFTFYMNENKNDLNIHDIAKKLNVNYEPEKGDGLILVKDDNEKPIPYYEN